MTIWSDRKFRKLSPMLPSAQALFFFLLTGPHTGIIPGLFRAGPAGMAEELGWDQEAFDEAFAELLAEGMVEADMEARLVWLPNAAKHNKPANPNVAISWSKELCFLPECGLLDRAVDSIAELMVGMGPAFHKAFTGADAPPNSVETPSSKTSPKPLAKASAKTSAIQEQEQEQDKEQAATPSGVRASAVGIKKFLEQCEADGVLPIPADDAVYAYADEIGLPDEYLVMAWQWFRKEMEIRGKRQKDWRAHFRNAVRGNWPKFWYAKSEGGWGLTTVGIQAQRAAA